MLSFWSLPGPARLINRTAVAVLRDRVRVLHAPRDAPGLAAALREKFERDAHSVLCFEGPGAHGFRVELADRVMAPGTSSMAGLAEHAALRGAVILMTARGPLDAELRALARLARRQRAETGPCLVVVSSDGGAKLDDAATEQIRNAAGPLDAAAYAAWLPRTEKQVISQLVASVAIEVAAWDVELLDRLMALPTIQAVRPDRHVTAWDEGRAGDWVNVALHWENGCLDQWGSEDAEHPAWLAANHPPALTKRVWRGQLATLLPWIEIHRLCIVRQHERRLRSVAEEAGGAECLDWGPIARHLRGSETLHQDAESFRRARNELAHGRPIDWQLIDACVRSSTRLQGK